MTIADDLKPIVWALRAIPAQFGLRPYRVSLVTGVNLGAHTGDEAGAYPEIVISEHGGAPPKVRQLNDEEIALANMGGGLWKVGPFTPYFTGATEGGNYLPDILGKNLDTGDTHYVRLVGPAYPDGALFRIVKVGHDHALHYELTIAPVSAEI